MLKLSINVIPQRYILGIMAFLATMNTYALRMVLNIAITQMTVQHEETNVDPNTCPENSIIRMNQTQLLGTTIKNPVYDWNESTKGIILSSFFWGYVVIHLPGGILSEKFGGKYILGIGILISSVVTLLTPLIIIATDGNWKILIITRILIGLGQGTSNPAINTLLSKWVPLSERSTIGTMAFAGAQMGTILSSVISGFLINSTETWSSVFYFFGGSGIIWYIFWQILCYSEPEQHPFISEEERAFLKKEVEGVSNKKPCTPWKAIFTSPAVWALVAAQAGHDWGFYTILTDLPSYMSEVLKFDIVDNGIWNSIPYLVMWICSMSTAKLCDWLITRRLLSVTFARKLFTTISSVGPSIFIMAASYTGCNKATTVAMFTIAIFFKGPFYCGFKVNALDIAPNHAGIIMAIVNGLGSLTGGVVPYLTGALTENHTLTEWRMVFWITVGVFTLTNVIFCLWGSGNLQEWNDLNNVKYQKDFDNDCKRASGNDKRQEV